MAASESAKLTVSVDTDLKSASEMAFEQQGDFSSELAMKKVFAEGRFGVDLPSEWRFVLTEPVVCEDTAWTLSAWAYTSAWQVPLCVYLAFDADQIQIFKIDMFGQDPVSPGWHHVAIRRLHGMEDTFVDGVKHVSKPMTCGPATSPMWTIRSIYTASADHAGSGIVLGVLRNITVAGRALSDQEIEAQVAVQPAAPTVVQLLHQIGEEAMESVDCVSLSGESLAVFPFKEVETAADLSQALDKSLGGNYRAMLPHGQTLLEVLEADPACLVGSIFKD
eukprot:TRINITY_DN78687_c0_g1_i1.p1 TRINITY_DN78687_c0_g1~~TRINITY_DN78687_c0_g1_i1.p1  ORF type:complete len:278 (-),score=49.81 TRINITY_DN78687_c0_g1_i1:129-962(-)